MRLLSRHCGVWGRDEGGAGAEGKRHGPRGAVTAAALRRRPQVFCESRTLSNELLTALGRLLLIAGNETNTGGGCPG